MTDAFKLGLIGFGLILFGWGGGLVGLSIAMRRDGEPWSEVRAALSSPDSKGMTK